MKTTKKQLKEIAKVEKKVAEVCGTEKGKVIFDEVTGIPYLESEIKSKKTIEVTRNEDVFVNKETNKPIFEVIDIGKKRNATEVTLNDKGVIVNKETGEPHFPKEKKSRNISINLSFGKPSPTLKKQIQSQGFVICKDYLNSAEEIRADLHALNRVGILKEKDLFKCFKRLSKKICKKIVDSEIKDGEIAIHKQTIIG